MDFLGAMKAIEQFAYELMSWVLFFPLTIYRVIINPVRMMDYVAAETEKDETVAFAAAMRPTLFLLLALTIGVLTVPFTEAEVLIISATRLGKAITDSWVTLVMFRMIVFTAFPIAGALIHDLFTPGEVDRNTLKKPFLQQCYIMAPFALITSPCLTLASRGDLWAGLALLVSVIWLITVETLFFRRQSRFGWVGSVFSGFTVFLIGYAVFAIAALVML
ncbi:MAG: hypothetical protein LCH47_12695 [Proteobacteria bacterium]|nr:hypothetical protein [Pseudomonadota bacterium]